MDHLPWGSSEKTWCFWRRENEWIYPEIQVASWAEVEIILADQSSVKTKLHEYQYTQINSQDFFSFHQKFFLDFPVTFIQASIEEIKVGSIRTTVGEIQAKHVFSSVSPPAKETHDLRLKQHFLVGTFR